MPSDPVALRLARLPESVVRQGAFPTGRPARVITPVYGALRRSFSGSTWYLAQAGLANNTLEGAFTLNSDSKLNGRLRVSGAAWKALRLLKRQKAGGYKFARSFSDVLWAQHIDQLAGCLIINNTQIYGPYFLKRFGSLGIKPCFYIDGTLTEYFYGYGAVEDQTIGQDIVKRAIEIEAHGYSVASRIFTMSSATARNLMEVYRIPASHISMVLPGANIDEAELPPPSRHIGWYGHEFTLGFVGLFPLRKGLDKLAEAVGILRARGVPIRLLVIGRCPDAIAAQDGVDFLGEINKENETSRFVAALRTVDLGCQLSRVELLGIAILEFLRLGIPVLATSTGGMPDVLASGGGLLVAADVTSEQLASILHDLVTDRDAYDALRLVATRRAAWASWSRAAHDIDHALQTTG